MKKLLTIIFTLLCSVSIVYAVNSACKVDYTVADSSFIGGADSCLKCHGQHKGILQSHMVTKQSEKAYLQEAFRDYDGEFISKNCNGCHVQSCSDCHKDKGKPTTQACTVCHNDSRVGMDYTGMGIREDHQRYQRGPLVDGQNYFKMLPDIHYNKGMQCGDCHSMRSLSGQEKAKQCLDCHKYSQSVVDHSIKGHNNVACVSCHAAWSPNEYGAFYMRFRESESQEYFQWVKKLSDEYMKSSFMRHNSTFSLAKDANGKYMPIRPQLIFFTNVYKDLVVGQENNMVADSWRVFTPHTVRKETVMCDHCHSDKVKYLLEEDDKRIFLLDKDGLKIPTFFNSRYFSIIGGSFVTDEEFRKIIIKDKKYLKYYFIKLKQVNNLVANGSQ